MKKIILAALLALLILPLALAGPAYASGLYDDKIVFGDNFTLSAGQTINGNLVIFGGNVTIEDGATVTGSVVVFGGSADVSGAVDENVVIFGGSTDLHSTAVVSGQLVTFGGSTSREEGAQVKGGESQGFEFNPGRGAPVTIDRSPFFDPLFRFFRAVFSAVALGLLALLVVLFWPDQAARVSAAIANSPGASGGLGLLTLIAVLILLVLTAITLCLIPLTIVGAILYAAAIIFGWLSLGMLVGARLSAGLNWRNLSPAVSAALGTFLFTLAADIIQIIVPCVGWMAPLLLAGVGLGAVTLTRFGTQPYLPNLPAQPAPPPPPAPAEGDATIAS